VEVRLIQDPGTLHRLYDKVIAPSFAPAEREPVERLAAALDDGTLRGAVAVAPGGDEVGALFLEWFPDIRAALLCYFAVRPDLRDQGVGRQLIAVATPQWRTELRPHVVYAEAEDPRFHGGVADYGDGDARLRLYAGFGARQVPIPYFLPELMPGEGRLPHLLLLVVEAGETVCPTSDTIDGAAVESFLTRYFTRQEGRLRDDDPDLRDLLAECRRTTRLPLHPLL
jgi:GNAT superfamily N-acetyltransferase